MDLTNIYIYMFILFTFVVFTSYIKTGHKSVCDSYTLNCIKHVGYSFGLYVFFPSHLGKYCKIRMKFHMNF